MAITRLQLDETLAVMKEYQLTELQQREIIDAICERAMKESFSATQATHRLAFKAANGRKRA